MVFFLFWYIKVVFIYNNFVFIVVYVVKVFFDGWVIDLVFMKKLVFVCVCYYEVVYIYSFYLFVLEVFVFGLVNCDGLVVFVGVEVGVGKDYVVGDGEVVVGVGIVVNVEEYYIVFGF